MIQQFKKFIAERKLQHLRLAVAISGGIDSVVLCELCAQAMVSFNLVHCNFGLRGGESDGDEAFVRSLASKYGVAVLVEKFDTTQYASQEKISIQEAARNLRYQWFLALHQAKQYDFLLLAHHANDSVETTLMNFFRGTGLDGLTGIPSAVSYIKALRPLLHHTRKEIESFVQANNLQWVEDSSNQSIKYTRNFFRHEVIPAIQKVYPQAEENVLNNINRFQQINALYQLGVQEIKNKVCRKQGEEVHIIIAKLALYLHTALIYEIIKEYGFGEKQVDEVTKLLESESGKFIQSATHQIIRHRNKLIITPKAAETQTIAVDKEVKQVAILNHALSFKTYLKDKWQLKSSNTIAQLDADKIEFPLLFRKWKTGDYFYPLGLRKKKKISRFFIDQKLSLADKEKVWIVESDKRIIWVMGYRIDDRFKITPSTKKVLEISISNP